MTLDYDEITKQTLDFDDQIRFAGVANSKGEMIAGGHKENVDKILDGSDVNMSIHYALQKRELYTNLAYKIGREKSAINEFEKVTLISIPLNSNEIFLISTEPRSNYVKIVDYIHSLLNF